MSAVDSTPDQSTHDEPPARLVTLDRVRGLAIVLMVLDHLAYVGGAVELRVTIGRLAMPLFFVLAGSLVTRLSWRHGYAVLLGSGLWLLAPWSGAQQVLAMWALGCALVVAARRWAVSPALVVAVVLTATANGVALGVDQSFDSMSLLALVALGALIGHGWAQRLGSRLPSFLEAPGRHPLALYAGHIVALEAVIWWLSRV